MPPAFFTDQFINIFNLPGFFIHPFVGQGVENICQGNDPGRQGDFLPFFRFFVLVKQDDTP